MKRVAAILLSAMMLVGIPLAGALPAQAQCKNGGSFFHSSISDRTSLLVTADWTDKSPSYAVLQGYHSDNVLPGCYNDADGFYNYSGWKTFIYNSASNTWSLGWGTTGWHKIYDWSHYIVAQKYCASSSWC